MKMDQEPSRLHQQIFKSEKQIIQHRTSRQTASFMDLPLYNISEPTHLFGG